MSFYRQRTATTKPAQAQEGNRHETPQKIKVITKMCNISRQKVGHTRIANVICSVSNIVNWTAREYFRRQIAYGNGDAWREHSGASEAVRSVAADGTKVAENVQVRNQHAALSGDLRIVERARAVARAWGWRHLGRTPQRRRSCPRVNPGCSSSADGNSGCHQAYRDRYFAINLSLEYEGSDSYFLLPICAINEYEISGAKSAAIFFQSPFLASNPVTTVSNKSFFIRFLLKVLRMLHAKFCACQAVF